ncbi:DUF6893 family small protein [Embleya sp. NBC_00896]
MRNILIRGLGAVALAGLAVLTVQSLPDIERYLRIRRM